MNNHNHTNNFSLGNCHSIYQPMESFNNIDYLIENTPKKTYNSNNFPLIMNSSHLLKNDKENSFIKGQTNFDFGQQDSLCNLDYHPFQSSINGKGQGYIINSQHGRYNFQMTGTGYIPAYDYLYEQQQYTNMSGFLNNPNCPKTPLTTGSKGTNFQKSELSCLKDQNSECQSKKDLADFSYVFAQQFKQPTLIQNTSEIISEFTANGGEDQALGDFNKSCIPLENQISAFTFQLQTGEEQTQPHFSSDLPSSNIKKRIVKRKPTKKYSANFEPVAATAIEKPKPSFQRSMRKKSVSSATTTATMTASQILPTVQQTSLTQFQVQLNNIPNDSNVANNIQQEDNSQEETSLSSFHSSDDNQVPEDAPNENSNLSESNEKQKKSSDSKPCNCRNSKCLKRYCDCFAAGIYCSADCKCEECHNTPDYEEERQKAIQKKKKRIKDAFLPVIMNNSHIKGCHCKNSHCQKKYCVCHQNGVLCSSLCQCVECENKIAEIEKSNQNPPNLSSASFTKRQQIESAVVGFQTMTQQPQQFDIEINQQQLSLLPLQSPLKIKGQTNIHGQDDNENCSHMEIEFESTAKKQQESIDEMKPSESELSTHKKPTSKRRSFRNSDKQKALQFFNEVSPATIKQ